MQRQMHFLILSIDHQLVCDKLIIPAAKLHYQPQAAYGEVEATK